MWIWGNGGHAKVIKSIRTPSAIIDDADPALSWKDEYKKDVGFIAIGDNKVRAELAGRLYEMGCGFAILNLGRLQFGAQVGDGSVLMAGSIVQPGAKIGKHCIVNTGATIDHDCAIADFVHIAPGCHLCGDVTVDAGTLVGAGTIVTPGVTIGPWLLIPAGSVVTKDCLNESDVAALRRR